MARVALLFHRDDAAFAQAASPFLQPVVRRRGASLWTPDETLPSEDRAGAPRDAVSGASIAIVLVSQATLADQGPLEGLLSQVLVRARAGALPLFVVPVGFCTYDMSPLAGTPTLNPVDLPLGRLEPVEQARWYAELARKLDALLLGLDAPSDATIPRPWREFERPDAARALRAELAQHAALLVLSPRGAGARPLLRHAFAAPAFPEAQVTWLSPSLDPECPADEYFRSLSDDASCASANAFRRWLHGRIGNTTHTVVLLQEGGSKLHLDRLGNVLRALKEEHDRRFRVVVAGKAHTADIRFNVPGELSLFAGMHVWRVPPWTDAETLDVAAHAGIDADAARALNPATGGLPSLLYDAVVSCPRIEPGALCAHLARSEKIVGHLRRHQRIEERADVAPRWRVTEVLRKMLAGEPVRRLDGKIEDDLREPEVKLYYDGLVVTAPDGTTAFRCEAVRHAAERVLGAD